MMGDKNRSKHAIASYLSVEPLDHKTQEVFRWTPNVFVC